MEQKENKLQKVIEQAKLSNKQVFFDRETLVRLKQHIEEKYGINKKTEEEKE